MKKLKFSLPVFLILFVVLAVLQKTDAQSRTDRVLIDEATRITKDNFPISSETPKGAKVFAVNQPSSKMLAAIDDGLADLFSVARKNGYTKRTNYSDYTIFIAKADRTRDGNKNYSQDIAVGAAQ